MDQKIKCSSKFRNKFEETCCSVFFFCQIPGMISNHSFPPQLFSWYMRQLIVVWSDLRGYILHIQLSELRINMYWKKYIVEKVIRFNIPGDIKLLKITMYWQYSSFEILFMEFPFQLIWVHLSSAIEVCNKVVLSEI